LWVSDGTDFAAGWLPGPVEGYWRVGAAKAENKSVFDVTENAPQPNRGISKIYTASVALFLPLYAQLFRVCKAGNFKVRLSQGESESCKKIIMLSPFFRESRLRSPSLILWKNV